MDAAVATPLAALEVLVVDCQTTGATPERGALLEVAWAPIRAAELDAGREPIVEAHLLQQPGGAEVPRRIRQLTGIGAKELEAAEAPEAVLGRLAALAERPRVAHFARFERAFLDPLEDAGHHWLCTHEIACRLLPGLPRRGLRALAGRLGHPMGETKRAGPHVEATAFVWAALVERLAVSHGIRSLDDLAAWLASTPPQRRGGRDFALPRDERLALPDAPGVYRMRGRTGEILYVGKAASLKKRVNSWFQKRHQQENALEMLTQVWRVEVEQRATALEAALFETDEIKRLAPPYNKALRGRDAPPSFLSLDLASVSAMPDASHVLGPFPHAADAAILPALLRLLHGAEEGWGDLPYLAGAEADARAAGLVLFRERHAPTPTPRSLLRLGMRLQALRALEAAAANEDESEGPPEEAEEVTGQERLATPEGVADALESALAHATRLVRRGRWLSWMLESTTLWQVPRREPGAPWRQLVMEEGHVARASDVAPSTDGALPPGWPRPLTRRLRAFDQTTLDRMRVFSTELRRLVAEGLPVEVVLGPGRSLDARALARRLAGC